MELDAKEYLKLKQSVLERLAENYTDIQIDDSHIEKIISEHVIDSKQKAMKNSINTLCDHKEEHFSLLSKIVSQLESNANDINPPKASVINMPNIKVSTRSVKPMNEMTMKDDHGFDYNFMVRVYPDKTMTIISVIDYGNDVKNHTNPVNDNLYPIPDYNDIISNGGISDIRDIFPKLSHLLSNDTNAIFWEANSYLRQIAYKIVYDDHNNSVRKIKLLEHNLARLLANSRHNGMPDKLFQFFIAYLQALRFADIEWSYWANRTTYMENDSNTVIRQPTVVEFKKLVNLTDYLLATLNSTIVPDNMLNDLAKLYDFLLVDMKNDVLTDFVPQTQEANGFIRELFTFLMKSPQSPEELKKIMEAFIPFIPDVIRGSSKT